jgi:hypothetical protein
LLSAELNALIIRIDISCCSCPLDSAFQAKVPDCSLIETPSFASHAHSRNLGSERQNPRILKCRASIHFFSFHPFAECIPGVLVHEFVGDLYGNPNEPSRRH